MKPSRKSFLHLGVLAVYGLFVFFSFVLQSSMALCSELPMIAGKGQMSISGQQELSILNYQTGNTYTWSIENDDGQKGTLSASTGENVIYTAPASNPDCANNPTIAVSRNGEAVGLFQMAVNGYSDMCELAYTVCCDEGCCPDFTCNAFYNCVGVWMLEDDCPTDLNCIVPCDGTGYHVQMWDWGHCGGDGIGNITDVRSAGMMTAGCCPEVLLPGYEPKPEIPEHIDWEQPVSKASPTVCPVDDVSDPISVYSGNTTESQEDLRFSSPNRRGFVFKRFYNSRSTANRNLGHGWKHTYRLLFWPSA
jgi:hypothetical protein